MLNLKDGVNSLTAFKRDTQGYLERIQKSGEPIALTINGKAAVVVQDAASYQDLVEKAQAAEKQAFVQAVMEGIDDAKAGRTVDARTAVKKLAKKYNLPEPTV